MSDDVEAAVAAAVASIGAASYGRIERAIMETASPFIQMSRISATMEEGVNRATIAEVKLIAGEMLAKVREYDPGNAPRHHAIVGDVLHNIAELIVDNRKRTMQRNIRDAAFSTRLSKEFEEDMQRVVDDAVRDVKHQRMQHTGGNTHVAIGDVNAPVNMAVGQNNRAQQTIVSDQFAELRDALAAFRAAAADPSVSEKLRLGVIDQLELIEAELAKPQPNEGKVKRLCKWFADKATGPAFGAAVGQLIAWLAS